MSHDYKSVKLRYGNQHSASKSKVSLPHVTLIQSDQGDSVNIMQSNEKINNVVFGDFISAQRDQKNRGVSLK